MAQSDRFSLGWLRVVDFLAVALLLQQAKPWLWWVPLRPLAALGKRSLGVFVAHINVLVVFCGPAMRLRSFPGWFVMLAILGPMAILAAALHVLDRHDGERRVSSASDESAALRKVRL